MKKSHCIWIAFALLMSFQAFAAADIPQNNALDMIISKFETETVRWEPIIHNLTLSMFWGLSTISFTWAFIQLVLKEGTGLVDVLAELVRRVLLIGFSLWMLNEAPNLARILIKSFTHVGIVISGSQVAFSPSNVFELGVKILTIIWSRSSIFEPVESAMFFIAALIIMICFALMAMEMTVLIVSGFIIVSGGIVAMGFLGSEWTRDNAINYFTAVLGVAFKMFIMQLVFIVGYSFITQWGSSITAQSKTVDLIVLIGCCIVFAGLMREIPSMAASLASGRFTMQGGGIGAAITTAAAITAGATLLGTAAAKQGYDMITGGGESGGGSDSPTPSQPQAQTMDTGAVDDGKGFAAKMQAQAHGGSTESAPAAASETNKTAEDIDDNPKAKHRASGALKSVASTTSTMTKSALEKMASRSSVGQILADGAKSLGEEPVDPATASPEDIHRQLESSLRKPQTSQPDEVQPENNSRFTDNIAPADNPYIGEDEQDEPDKRT